ncbi:hypothetical protein BGZ76_011140 [Entomortierella beljakovae]|nr:hypothetical protein BGZ76_011140 [Entomortierella beljakovae]
MFETNSHIAHTNIIDHDDAGLSLWFNPDNTLLSAPSQQQQQQHQQQHQQQQQQQQHLLNYPSDSSFPISEYLDNHSTTTLDTFSLQDFSSSLIPDLPFQSIAAPTQFDNETVRHAAMLHAYLASQTLSIPQQWSEMPITQSDMQIQQAQILDQMKQLELQQQQQQQQQLQQQIEEENEQEKQREQLAKVQKDDALILAQYLAQVQSQIKEETPSDTAMEYDTASPPHSPPSSSSSSTSSEADDKSPRGSPTFMERSLCSKMETNSSSTSKSSTSCLKLPPRQPECFNCKVTQTPLWRRTPDRMHSLCNACGLYYKQYGAHRPLNVRHKLSTIVTEVRNTLPYARPSMTMSRSTSPSGSGSGSDGDSDGCSSSGKNDSNPSPTKMCTDALIPPPSTPTSQRVPPLMIAKQGIQCANCSQTQTPLWRKNDAGDPICNACGLYAKLHNRDRPVTMRKAKITRRRRDWGGNLAHQAQIQAQALALAQARELHLVEGTESEVLEQSVQIENANCGLISEFDNQSLIASIVEDMTFESEESADCQSSSVESSDSEEEQQPEVQQQQQEMTFNSATAAAATTTDTAATTPSPNKSSLAQGLSNNLIMDDIKFTDLVGQMNAHQMNRFLSILETRCGKLREILLATTDVSSQQASSSLDQFFQ